MRSAPLAPAGAAGLRAGPRAPALRARGGPQSGGRRRVGGAGAPPPGRPMRAGHDRNPPAAPPRPVFDAGAGGIAAGGYLFIAFLQYNVAPPLLAGGVAVVAPLRLCLRYFRFVSRIVVSSSCMWSSGHVADIETDMSASCPRGAWRQAMRVTETRLGLRLGIVSCPIDLVRNQAAFFKRPGQVAPCGPFRNLGSAS